MAISYLSSPLQSTVQPYQENVALIAQVAAKKTNKYDNVLDTIFQKQDELLSLDTSLSSHDITAKKDDLIKKASDELNSMATLDFLNPENIKRAEDIFTPITGDDEIILGVARTKQNRKELATYDELEKKHPDLYDPTNRKFTIDQINKGVSMGMDEYKANNDKLFTGAVKYRNRKKEYADAASKLGIGVEKTEIFKDGVYIYTTDHQWKKAEDIVKVLPNDAGMVAQARVDAWASMGNITQNDLLTDQVKRNYANVETNLDINSKLTTFNKDVDGNIKLLNANDPTVGNIIKKLYPELKNIDLGKKENRDEVVTYLQNKKKENEVAVSKNESENKDYMDYIGQMKKAYGIEFDNKYNVISSKPIDEWSLLDLKTQTLLQRDKADIATAFMKDLQKTTVTVDEMDKMNIKHQQDIDLENLQTRNSIIKAEFDAKIKAATSTATATSTSTTEASGTTGVVEGGLQAGEGTMTDTKLQVSRSIVLKEMQDDRNNIGVTKVGDEYKISKYGEGTNPYKGAVKQLTDIKYINTDYDKIPGVIETEKKFQLGVDDWNQSMAAYNGNDADVVPGRAITYGQYKKDNKLYGDYVTTRDLRIAELKQRESLYFGLKEKVKQKVLANKPELGVNDDFQFFTNETYNVSHIINAVKNDPSLGGLVQTNDGGVVLRFKQFKVDPKISESVKSGKDLTETDFNTILRDNGLNLPTVLPDKIRQQTQDYIRSKTNTNDLDTEVGETLNDALEEHTRKKKIYPLLPRDYSTTKSPSYSIVQDAKSIVLNSFKPDAGIDASKITILSFDPNASGGWDIEYSAESKNKHIDYKKASASNDFVMNHVSELQSFIPMKIYDIMLTQKQYNEANLEYSVPETIVSAPIKLNGKVWKMAIMPGDPDGFVRLASIKSGNDSLTINDMSQPLGIQDAWNAMSGTMQKTGPQSISDLANEAIQKIGK